MQDKDNKNQEQTPDQGRIEKDLPAERNDIKLRDIQREEDRSAAGLEDKEPAGDGGPEDAVGKSADKTGKDAGSY